MLKILVVDDEMFVRRGIVMETDWAAMDCAVVAEASNGEEALEAVHRYRPDLIISDIRMPRMDGIELLKTLRQEGNEVRVIFLTAYSEFEYAKQALRYFAFDYLLKPFEDGELEECVLRAKKEIEEQRDDRKNQEQQTVLAAPEEQGDKSRYIREALNYIAEHYGDSDISIATVSAAVGISESHLSHLFKKETDYTVAAYITRYRMRAAMKLLEDCRNRVSEVAEQVGYRDITYFSSTFKKIVGMTPSEYQNRRE
ncbi:MAG: response regulator [Lachnospiraceae bacterium]|nr:response regulator [Lachnospiraceae bacterium]